VVNEALEEDGSYRSSPFYNTIGEAFIPLAFKFAKKYSPKSELYYNDYNLEYNGNKTRGAERIVKLIKSYGVHIDGVGLQAHLAQEVTPTAGALPSQAGLETVLKGLTALDVDVVYTEIDIRMNTPATPEKLKAQAKAYESVARSCLAVKRCVGMTVWGISDAFSWIPVSDSRTLPTEWNTDCNHRVSSPVRVLLFFGTRTSRRSPLTMDSSRVSRVARGRGDDYSDSELRMVCWI